MKAGRLARPAFRGCLDGSRFRSPDSELTEPRLIFRNMSEKPSNILLLESTREDAKAVQQLLAQTDGSPIQVEWVDRFSKGLTRLEQGGIDLVLLDPRLPDAKGIDLIEAIHAKARGVPLLILASDEDEVYAKEAVKLGAQDYLLKSYLQVSPGLLSHVVHYAIGRKRMEEREQALTEAVAQTALSEGKRAAKLDAAYQELKEMQALLVQAEKMTAIGQLASGIAHEVKNPLNIILQSVNYLEPELKQRGGHQAEVLQVMREAVMTADKIVRGLLDFSRPTSPDFKSTAISDVVDASLVLVRTQLASKRIRLTTEVPEDLPRVMVDDTQMKQVFINLILNAFHAMPGGGELTIRGFLKTLTHPGRGVGSRLSDLFRVGDTVLVCEVQDTGTGIPKELLPRVFNPFFTTKPPGEGVGLGLAATLAIVQAHRATMHIDSEEGRGTTVVMMLPLAPSQQPPPGPATQKGSDAGR